MSVILPTFWLAEGRTLQAIRDYQKAQREWIELYKARGAVILAKYGAKSIRGGGGLTFERGTITDEIRERFRRDQTTGVWYPRQRSAAGKKVEGGLELTRELLSVDDGSPDWSRFVETFVPSAPLMINGRYVYDGTPGFEEIGDQVILKISYPAEDNRVPLDCTKKLLLWEVEKMKHEAEVAKQACKAPATQVS